VRNTSRVYELKCKKDVCPWRVHAYWEMEGLSGVLNCQRAHMSFAGHGEVSSQPDIIIHCR
jgi:hypothetical protein